MKPSSILPLSLSLVLLLPCAAVMGETADEYYTSGMASYSAGHYEDAVTALRKALEQDPNHAEALKLLLWVLAELQEEGAQTVGAVGQLTANLKVLQEENQLLKDALSESGRRLVALSLEHQGTREERDRLARELEETGRSLRMTEAVLAQSTKRLTDLTSQVDQVEMRRHELEAVQEALDRAERTVFTEESRGAGEEPGVLNAKMTIAQAREAVLKQQLAIMARQAEEREQKMKALQRANTALSVQRFGPYAKREGQGPPDLQEQLGWAKQTLQLTQELEGQRQALAALETASTQSAKQVADLEAERRELQKTNAALEQALNERSVQLADLQERLAKLEAAHQASLAQAVALRQTLETKEEELSAAQDVAEKVQAVKADDEQLRSALAERGKEVLALQNEVERLQRRLSGALGSLNQVDVAFHTKEQRLEEERHEYMAQFKSLRKDLLEARNAQRSPFTDRLTQVEPPVPDAVAHERAMASAPEEIEQAREVPSDEAGATPSAPAQEEAEETETSQEISEAEEERVSSPGYPVEVFQVDGQWGFMVLSVARVEGAEEGTKFLLSGPDDKRVATIQLTELAEGGFAVAQITRRIDPLKEIRKGDTLFAHQLF